MAILKHIASKNADYIPRVQVLQVGNHRLGKPARHRKIHTDLRWTRLISARRGFGGQWGVIALLPRGGFVPACTGQCIGQLVPTARLGVQKYRLVGFTQRVVPQRIVLERRRAVVVCRGQRYRFGITVQPA